MPALRYSPEELLHLRQSPLVQKPDELPNIEQWAEPQPQNKARSGTAVRSEENENPRQRGLSQFESRGTRHAKKDGEEVFLGPKMSFASASAARQANKASYQESDEVRKFDRFAPREGRERTRDSNGGEARFRNKLSVDEDEDRAGKFRNRPSNGRDDDPKRAGRGLGRGKFDQPWFRDSNKDASALDDPNDAKSAWREEKPRRAADKEWGRRSKDEDPGWELSGASNEPAARTIDDFQKWKERMKAGDGATPQSEQTATLPAEQIAEKPKMAQASFFGNLGAVEDAPLESTTPKPASKKGKSRFQSFFGANDEPLPPEPPSEPVASPKLAQTSTEDQAGFERMMAMLRMGGTNSQGPGPQLFSAPQSQNTPKSGPPPGLPAFFDSTPASPPAQTQKTPASPTSQSNRTSQPPASDRNSEFLLNLMKSQQPRTPFTEGQIYGQGYERKTPDNNASRYPPPPSSQSRGQASRFFSGEQPVTNSTGPAPQSPPHDNHASRFMKEQRPPPGFDQPQPPPQQIFSGRPPSPQRMQPPPGFPSRPPPPSSQHIPPGFYNPQFPPHMGGPGAGPMRGPMPQQPPGFFSPPPGFPSVPPGMHGPAPGQRRSGGVPPGFDVFAGAHGPGAPPGPGGRPMMGPGIPPPPGPQGMPPSQGGYAQYAQQMGAGVYKGM